MNGSAVTCCLKYAFRRRGSERLLRGGTSSNSTSFEEGSPHGVNLGYLSE